MDPSQNQNPSGRGSSGDFGHGPAPSRASVPPSEPRSTRASFEALDAEVDRPARLQMIVALLLGLVLVAIPLYLWRRPQAESIQVSTTTPEGGATGINTPTPAVEEKLSLAEPRVLSCHDPGPKKTPPEQCDHVVELEHAFAKAIEDGVSCVPKDAGGGTIIYVADVNVRRRTVAVTTPKESRTLKSSKVAGLCERAVKSHLSLNYESMKHEHARYRVAITATYPGAVKP